MRHVLKFSIFTFLSNIDTASSQKIPNKCNSKVEIKQMKFFFK